MGGINNFFNVGFSELMFILILAGLVLGPHRIRDIARWLGKLTAQSRQIARQFTKQLEAELDESEVAELRGAMADIRSLRQEVAELRREVLKGPAALIDESGAAAEKIKQDINNLQQELSDLDETISEETQTINLPNVVDIEDDPAI